MFVSSVSTKLGALELLASLAGSLAGPVHRGLVENDSLGARGPSGTGEVGGPAHPATVVEGHAMSAPTGLAVEATLHASLRPRAVMRARPAIRRLHVFLAAALARAARVHVLAVTVTEEVVHPHLACLCRPDRAHALLARVERYRAIETEARVAVDTVLNLVEISPVFGSARLLGWVHEHGTHLLGGVEHDSENQR